MERGWATIILVAPAHGPSTNDKADYCSSATVQQYTIIDSESINSLNT